MYHQDAVRVNSVLSVLTIDGSTHYFHCLLPIGRHAADDRCALLRRVGEMAAIGTATPRELACACGLGLSTVRRAVRVWREQGEAGFYSPRKPRARTAVTPEIKRAAERALTLGASLRLAARKVGLHVETLRRNIRAGVVAKPSRPTESSEPAADGERGTDPAGRNLRDKACRMGRATWDVAGSGVEPEVTLVFDREGWSPALFQRLARQGVACITWRKGPAGADWPEREFDEFQDVERRVTMQLAERRVTLLDAPQKGKGAAQCCGQAPFRVREIRWLTPAGRQLSLVTPHPSLPRQQVAAALESRWSQENYFKYSRQEFGFDELPEHRLERVDPGEKVRNPDWNLLDSLARQAREQRARLRDQAAQATQEANRCRHKARGCEGRRAEKLEERAAALRAKAQELRRQTARRDNLVTVLAERRRSTPQHVLAGELPQELRYDALPEASRHFALTLQRIA